MHSCEEITARNSPDYSRQSGQDEWCKERVVTWASCEAELPSHEPPAGGPACAPPMVARSEKTERLDMCVQKQKEHYITQSVVP